MLVLPDDYKNAQSGNLQNQPEKAEKSRNSHYHSQILDNIYLWVKNSMQINKWYNLNQNLENLQILIDSGIVPEIELSIDKTKVRKIDFGFLEGIKLFQQ